MQDIKTIDTAETIDTAAKSGYHTDLSRCLVRGDKPTATTLNMALLSGQPHFMFQRLLDAGAQPDSDTLTCALFSDIPHYTLRLLWVAGAKPSSQDLEHIQHSHAHHALRSEILGKGVTSTDDNVSEALKYAEEKLGYLKVKFGPFRSLERELENEKHHGKHSGKYSAKDEPMGRYTEPTSPFSNRKARGVLNTEPVQDKCAADDKQARFF